MHRKFMVLSIPTAFALLSVVNDAQAPAPAPSAAPSRSVGMIINIDPVTGAIVEQAAPSTTKLAVPAEMAERWSTSDEGLVVQPNPSGGKGVYVNFQGRFENGMVATVKTDGTLAAPCAEGLTQTAGHPATEK
ncbi:MAG TPA: hypothetical protein VF247_03435 [Candidatus Krumholzibacteria bacterium]